MDRLHLLLDEARICYEPLHMKESNKIRSRRCPSRMSMPGC